MIKFFRKFLVYVITFAGSLLISNEVYAQTYVMKTAFVGDLCLKDLVVGKIFDESHRVFEDASSVCGIRFTTPIDSILYKFSTGALNPSRLRDTALHECGLIFMVVDFSSPKVNLNDVLIKNFGEIRDVSDGKQIILIAMNTSYLPESDLKKLDSARVGYGKNNFDYVLTSYDEEDEIFRKKFFEVTDRMIDWRRLPPSVESNVNIISRLGMLRMMKLDRLDEKALVAEMIRQDNARIFIEQHVTDFERRATSLERDMAVVKTDVASIRSDVEGLKLTVDELRRVKYEQNQMNEFMQSLTELSFFIRTMSATGTFNSDESERILARVNASISNLNIPQEEWSTNEPCADDEMKNLRRHMIEMKRRLAENIEDVNGLKALTKGLKTYMDEEKTLHELLIADRVKWENRAIEIDKFADSLKRDEQHLEAISEGKTKGFIWKQYQQSGWFGKMRLRTMFPFIKDELKLKR